MESIWGWIGPIETPQAIDKLEQLDNKARHLSV
jgi:hypothetical protein